MGRLCSMGDGAVRALSWVASLTRPGARFVGACFAVAVLLLLLPWRPPAKAADLEVKINFPGGSGKVSSIDQRKRIIRLSPSFHKDLGWVCWWYIKVVGIRPGETITLDLGDGPFATPDRASYSTDNETWRQTKMGMRWGNRIVYQQAIDAKEAWFAWGPPFVSEDSLKTCKSAAKRCRHAKHFEMCKSRGGRPVPALRVSEPGAKEADRHGVWVQGRQHAWEAGSSWVCRGFTEWLVSDDPRAESLRQKTDVTVVPVVAVDNVELGAGGKDQVPHDHNRDWGDDPMFNVVDAAIKEIKAQNATGRFALFVDVHNSGAISKNPFYFTPPRSVLGERGDRNLDRFLAASREEIAGPLKFKGEAFESGPMYDKDRWTNIAKNWVCLNTADHVVSVTLEVPWNTKESTADGYLQLGREFGLATERYLRLPPREK
jgi:zinc carboxypeptidase